MTLIAKPIQNGYSFTLTTRLGHMLRLAEQAHGARDMSYTILGIEFEASGPKLWFPGNCNFIAIQLSFDAANDMVLGCYQLAHECIHLLSPTGSSQANVLEEGLATCFARNYVSEVFGAKINTTIASYQHAAELADELLAIDPNAIRELRMIEPVISRITARQMIERYPSLETATAAALEAQFVRGI
ncbi:hypothetical protein [Xenophilus sp. Marseille-Q4582]|uniref:hypothetical protein n=1 Tax=Xenophilus sp. Marseille-Q4582 TaxID=2866600 RepID=UPI001CE41C52|nr:hypothetical protein [Xenophilus sp. Marseille-Q4582]